MAPTGTALLLTTIGADPDDWCVERFSMLAGLIRAAGEARNPSFKLLAQNHPSDSDDRLKLQNQLRSGRFDQVWLIAPDLDNGPDPAFFKALEAAVAGGTHLVVATDHTDLGSCLLQLDGCLSAVARTQTFGRDWPDLPSDREYVNAACPGITRPCVVTGQNGGVQICRVRANHPILAIDTTIEGHLILPAHPHEGVLHPQGPHQQVLLSSYSISSGREQITAVLDEDRSSERGVVLHHSTFHHFADFNLNVTHGCPSFVIDPPSNQIQDSPALLNDLKAYVSSVVGYLIDQSANTERP